MTRKQNMVLKYGEVSGVLQSTIQIVEQILSEIGVPFKRVEIPGFVVAWETENNLLVEIDFPPGSNEAGINIVDSSRVDRSTPDRDRMDVIRADTMGFEEDGTIGDDRIDYLHDWLNKVFAAKRRGQESQMEAGQISTPMESTHKYFSRLDDEGMPRPPESMVDMEQFKEEASILYDLSKVGNKLDACGAHELADDVDYIVLKLASEGVRIKVFAYLLACTRAFAAVAQSYHWRTKGGHFYGDHLLFERIYGEANDMIDSLAEKGIGVSGDDGLAEVNKQTQLVAEITTKHAPENTKEEDFPKVLLEYSEHRVKMIGDMLKELRDADESSDGIENLLQEFADKHEEHVYLLQRRTKEATVKIQLSKKADGKDKIPGGLADKKQPKDFDAKQLAKGIKVEMEHTDDKKIAREIAMDHLTEDKKYYDKLEKVEKHKEADAKDKALAIYAQDRYNYEGTGMSADAIGRIVMQMQQEEAMKAREKRIQEQHPTGQVKAPAQKADDESEEEVPLAEPAFPFKPSDESAEEYEHEREEEGPIPSDSEISNWTHQVKLNIDNPEHVEAFIKVNPSFAPLDYTDEEGEALLLRYRDPYSGEVDANYAVNFPMETSNGRISSIRGSLQDVQSLRLTQNKSWFGVNSYLAIKLADRNFFNERDRLTALADKIIDTAPKTEPWLPHKIIEISDDEIFQRMKDAGVTKRMRPNEMDNIFPEVENLSQKKKWFSNILQLGAITWDQKADGDKLVANFDDIYYRIRTIFSEKFRRFGKNRRGFQQDVKDTYQKHDPKTPRVNSWRFKAKEI